MTEYYMDFFNTYIIGNVQILFQLYFFVKFLNRKVTFPVYLLFVVCAVIIFHFVSNSTIVEFGVFVFFVYSKWNFAIPCKF